MAAAMAAAAAADVAGGLLVVMVTAAMEVPFLKATDVLLILAILAFNLATVIVWLATAAGGCGAAGFATETLFSSITGLAGMEGGCGAGAFLLKDE